MIEGDIFRIIVKVPEFGPSGNVKSRAQEAQEAQVDFAKWQIDLLIACFSGEKSGKELLKIAGHKTRTGNFKKGLQRLIDEKLLEWTIPDKPSSRLQKYRLTEKGRRVLTRMQGGAE